MAVDAAEGELMVLARRTAGRPWAGVALLLSTALLGACTATGAPQAAAHKTTGPTRTSSTAPTTTTTAALPAAVVTMDPPIGASGVLPTTPIVINAGNGTLTSVSVTSPDGQQVAGALSPDALHWQAAEVLGYDAAYQVRAMATNAAGKKTVLAGSFSTVTPRTLTYPSMIPAAGTQSVGVGQPIAVYFDEGITDKAAAESHMTVTTTPPVAGRWSWFSDREAHFRPEQFWAPGTHVAVDLKLYGVNVGADIYGQEDRHIEFDIGDAMVAKVDDGELQLRAYRNGELVRTMPTAMGKPGFETYSGTYVVTQQSRTYTMDSSTYGLPIDDPNGYRTEVEFASRISSSGIFVHAAPWSIADQGMRDVSHGCLNVSPDDAEWFYENFGPGDVVQVTGTGVPLQPSDGFGDWNMSWSSWVAGSALP